MNLTCSVYTTADYPAGDPRLSGVPCQWRGVAKTTSPYNAVSITSFSVPTEILLPAGTDVRSIFETAGTTVFDVILLTVEGGQLPFNVIDVYDVGKGFSNEYRVAAVVKRKPWPVPIP